MIANTDAHAISGLRARLRACRSFFLTPASRPDSFAAVRGRGDALILDLESTVRTEEKASARDVALAFFRQPADVDFMRILRINSPRTIEGLRDLLALDQSSHWPDAVIIPKCQSADETRLVAEIFEGSPSMIGLIPMIELARAVFVADLIANAHELVCSLFLGGGDLSADLGADGSWESLLYARSRIVAAAATNGIAVIDVPYFKGDHAGLRQEAVASRKLGMTGKAALRADQLATITEVFTHGRTDVRETVAVQSD
jgi:(S)-citramalyl-CoA lyase